MVAGVALLNTAQAPEWLTDAQGYTCPLPSHNPLMILLGEARTVWGRKGAKAALSGASQSHRGGGGSAWRKAETGGATFERTGGVKAHRTPKP